MIDPHQAPLQPHALAGASHPLISIIIPAFNVAPYLQACLDSVFLEVDAMHALARADFEIIIIDDCSTDATATLARALLGERKDARITSHAINRGLAAARNTGIDASRGDYLLFLDSDNILLEGALPRIVDALLGNAAIDALILGMDLIDVRGERTGAFYGNRVLAQPLELLRRDPFLLLDGNIMDNFSVIRASMARKARYDESLRRLEDWDLWIRLRYEHQCTFAMLEVPAGGYRIRPGQLTQEHTLQNRSFLGATLQIYAKALAMAMRLNLPTQAVQRLLAHVQTVGAAYVKLSSAPAQPEHSVAGQRSPARAREPIDLTTTQLSIGRNQITFGFRADCASDKAVISRIYRGDDLNLANSAEGRRFLAYYVSNVNTKPGLVIDADAYIGASTVYFLELFKNSLVCAIEPEIENFRILEFNTRTYQNKKNLHGSMIATENTSRPRGNDTGIPEVGLRAVLEENAAAVPMILKCSIESAADDQFSGEPEWMRRFPVILMQGPHHGAALSGAARDFTRAACAADFEVLDRGNSVFLFNRQLLT